MVADTAKGGIGSGQEQVATAQRRVLSELVPDRRDASPVKVAVLQIIMDERSIVQQFGTGCDADGLAFGQAKGQCRAEAETRPYFLAARPKMVFGRRGNAGVGIGNPFRAHPGQYPHPVINALKQLGEFCRWGFREIQ